MDVKSLCKEKILLMLNKTVNQENMLKYITMQARFPQMNHENILLLLDQLPNATAVCGRGAWREYSAEVMEGQKPAALFGPVITMVDYEDEEVEAGDELDNMIAYDIVAVFDISQTKVSEDTPDFTATPSLSRTIEAVIKDSFEVGVFDDQWNEVLPNKLIKSQYVEDKKAIYLKAGLEEGIRNAELLKQYSKLCVNRKGVTEFIDALDYFLMLTLAKHFNISGIEEKVHHFSVFEASEEDKLSFLQKLYEVVFEAVCEMSGKNLLSFNETAFCNLLFTTDDLSDALSEIGAAAEMPETEGLHEELCTFLDRMHMISEETYQFIRKKRQEQTLFTFPPTDISI